VEVGDIDFRKRAKLPAKVRDSIKEQLREQLERYAEVETLFASEPLPHSRDAFGRFTVNSLEDAEIAAQKLREHWNIGFDAIPNLTQLLEDKGIKVLVTSAPEDFDGLMATIGENDFAIMTNRELPPDRQRFTLAHELGHAVMRVAEDIDEEKACHRFAGAFLFPDCCVKQEFGEHRSRVLWTELKLVKEKYGISMQAAMRRMLDVGLLTESAYKSNYFMFSRAGFRKSEPGKVAVERAERFELLAWRALAEGLITPSKTAEVLKLSINDIDRALTGPEAE
jgi:Zn-dependent peptidase ImmA (M78 family)